MAGSNAGNGALAAMATKIAIAVAAFALSCVWAAAASSAPYAYVLNYGSEDLSVIDLFSGTEVARIDIRSPQAPAGNVEPHELIVHPSEETAYVLARDYVAFVDLVTRDPADVDYFPLPETDSRGFALDPAGDQLFVSYRDSATVTVVSASCCVSSSLVFPIEDIRYIGISGFLFFGVNDDGSVVRWDMRNPGARVIGTGTFDNPEDLTISDNGQHVLVGSRSLNRAYIFSIHETTLDPTTVDPFSGSFHPGRIRALPNGDVAIVDRSGGGIELRDAQGNYLDYFSYSSAANDVGENEAGTFAALLGSADTLRVDSALGNFDVRVGSGPSAVVLGRGNVGELRISPDPVQFRFVSAGNVVTKVVQIESVGDRPVRISSIGVAGSGPFQLLSHTCPGSLAPGASCSATVRFVAPNFSRSCTAVFNQLLCQVRIPSYRDFLKVENDATSNPTSGVDLWAGQFTREELKIGVTKVQASPFEGLILR